MDLVCSIYFCIDFIHSYDKALANVIRFFAKNNIASIKVRTYNAKDANRCPFLRLAGALVASKLAPRGVAAAELGSHSAPNLVGATGGRPRARNARPYGVVRFLAYSVGERLGAPVF